MKHLPWAGASWLIVLVVGAGCTSLREIPRSEYAARPERKHVRMQTNDGLIYEFDFVQVQGDSLVGYRQRDVPGSFEEFGSVKISLHDVRSLSTRSVDWYRTGLIGGGMLAAVVVAGLSSSGDSSGEGSGGTGPRDGP